MRKSRVVEQNRCYHLVSRLAHRAFFLDDEGKDRAVALMRRVEEFSGVVVLAYASMSDHFHIFVYVPKAEEIDEAEVMRRIRALYRDASLAQVVATAGAMPSFLFAGNSGFRPRRSSRVPSDGLAISADSIRSTVHSTTGNMRYVARRSTTWTATCATAMTSIFMMALR